jgi:hypothetical protein
VLGDLHGRQEMRNFRRSFAEKTNQESVSAPQAARGCAHPSCRPIKTQSCFRLGSAFEAAAFQKPKALSAWRLLVERAEQQHVRHVRPQVVLRRVNTRLSKANTHLSKVNTHLSRVNTHLREALAGLAVRLQDLAQQPGRVGACQILPLPISRYRSKFQSNLVWDSIKSISNFCFQF